MLVPHSPMLHWEVILSWIELGNCNSLRVPCTSEPSLQHDLQNLNRMRIYSKQMGCISIHLFWGEIMNHDDSVIPLCWMAIPLRVFEITQDEVFSLKWHDSYLQKNTNTPTPSHTHNLQTSDYILRGHTSPATMHLATVLNKGHRSTDALINMWNPMSAVPEAVPVLH